MEEFKKGDIIVFRPMTRVMGRGRIVEVRSRGWLAPCLVVHDDMGILVTVTSRDHPRRT